MYYYNNELPPQQGWVCPKCGRVNAPWLPTCGCVSSQTSGTPYLVKTSSISRGSHEIAKDEPHTDDYKKHCVFCKWVYEPNVCGRCRNMNLFADAIEDEPQTERSE